MMCTYERIKRLTVTNSVSLQLTSEKMCYIPPAPEIYAAHSGSCFVKNDYFVIKQQTLHQV